MKTPFCPSLAITLVAALLTVLPTPQASAQGTTTTAEDAALSAAEAAFDAAWDANKLADDTEMDANMNGNREVDVDRAKILRKRADEAIAAFVAALAKAEEAMAKVPSTDRAYYVPLEDRLKFLQGWKDMWTQPPPTETGGDVKQQSLASGGVFGDFNGDGKADLVGKVVSITGTGETIGHVADVTLTNSSNQKITLTIPPTVLHSAGGQYQPYILPKATQVTLAPNSTKTVPLDGVCMDGRKPPVGDGVAGELALLNPAAASFPKPYRAQLAGGQRLIAATTALQNAGKITTPFSGNPEKERETVIQQTFWIYSARLNGKPYTKEEFANKLYAQGGFKPPNDLTEPVPRATVAKAGAAPKTTPSGAVVTPDPVIKPQTQTTTQPATTPPTPPSGAVVTPDPKTLKEPTEAQKKTLDSGVDQFWSAFQLTGKEAKILD